MNNEIVINMKDQIFLGDILDIGSDNYGVIYKIYKNNNSDFNVEYLDNKEQFNEIKHSSYDTCVMFLSFSSIVLKSNKKKFMKKIYDYLKEDGIVYIWDIDKGYGRIFNNKIKVTMLNDVEKEINFKEFNILKNSSLNSIKDVLNNFFDIIESRCLNRVYYIKARKRRRNDYGKIESITGGDKL
ncbi:hypothetical protein Z959_04865 [Clostridium novyi B str. ATCC 27606]|uniref:Uncharacterized protein n=3 Tax=Clostridium TaxID=1485 RepID=A0AA40IVP8_CLONO|nr:MULTISPECIES: hypothetical protein [Clostridium]KEI16473.1 hypothetical protein Z960_09185 [Clostridium haemolyticum NCTC 9693]KEI18117.1 hypothetical protein Z959_04865 [Clostridium novyi B str. ATCC 27606]KGN04320.1 hypothetical protein Z961_03220 [Clostridium haemolyticum NCTC 8350]CAG7840212.1 hypothetical protein CLOHAE12215_01636 [Clostridium haemolyticum]